MISLDLRMTLISLTVVPFIFAFAIIFFWKVKKAFQEQMKPKQNDHGAAGESHRRTCARAFANQAYELSKFEEKAPSTASRFTVSSGC